MDLMIYTPNSTEDMTWDKQIKEKEKKPWQLKNENNILWKREYFSCGEKNHTSGWCSLKNGLLQ